MLFLLRKSSANLSRKPCTRSSELTILVCRLKTLIFEAYIIETLYAKLWSVPAGTFLFEFRSALIIN